MTNDKNYLVSGQELIDVADTIRTKTNSSGPIAWPEGFKEKSIIFLAVIIMIYS